MYVIGRLEVKMEIPVNIFRSRKLWRRRANQLRTMDYIDSAHQRPGATQAVMV